MKENLENQSLKWKNFYKIEPFISTTLAGMLPAFISHPIDTLKTRIQAFSEMRALNPEKVPKFTLNFKNCAIYIWKNEGWWGFYKGIDAMQLRMFCLSPSRFGTYKWTLKYLENKHPNHQLTVIQRCLVSGFSGFVSGIFMNPTDLCLVRFQADNSLPPEQRRNYKNIFDALIRIVREEGKFALFKGLKPQIYRSVIITTSQLVTMDETKKFLNKISKEKDTFFIRMTSAAVAGCVVPIITMPFDNLKTKIQKQTVDSRGILPYKGVMDCFVKSVQREGFFRLWIGVDAFFFRAGIHVFLTCLLMEYIPDIWKRLEGKN